MSPNFHHGAVADLEPCPNGACLYLCKGRTCPVVNTWCAQLNLVQAHD